MRRIRGVDLAHCTAPAAVLLLLAVLSVTMIWRGDARAQSGPCSQPLALNFSGLPAGTILGEQYADLGVHISAIGNENHPDALIVFDTNAPPTHDPDLAVHIGNIAVLAENLNDENSDGLVDDPDENNFGGHAFFRFDQPMTVGSFLFVDKDHSSADFAIAYNAANQIIATVPIPQSSEGSVQQIQVNAAGVSKLELDYNDSGGFTGLTAQCTPTTRPTPTLTATVPPPPLTPTAQPATPTRTAPVAPTIIVTTAPTVAPTIAPTASPTVAPTIAPTATTIVTALAQTPAKSATPIALGVQASPTVAPTLAPTSLPASLPQAGGIGGVTQAIIAVWVTAALAALGITSIWYLRRTP